MSSSRLLYDNCTVKTQIKDSTSPLSYQLFLGKYKNCNSCTGKFANDLNFGERASVESELRNNGIRAQSKCAGLKYNPKQSNQGNPISPHLLCERDITPHNQKMPVNPGFDVAELSKDCC